jgi:hypothetical protein
VPGHAKHPYKLQAMDELAKDEEKMRSEKY